MIIYYIHKQNIFLIDYSNDRYFLIPADPSFYARHDMNILVPKLFTARGIFILSMSVSVLTLLTLLPFGFEE